jgi:uncharacterized membrane protein
MADYQAIPTQEASRRPPVGSTLAVYVLFAIAAVVGLAGHGVLVGAPLFTLVGVIAVVIAYVTRGDARGTWAESHLSWLIRTFWWSLLWNALGWLVAVTVIGLPVAIAIWVGTTIWVIYRLIRGYLRFNRSEPVAGM